VFSSGHYLTFEIVVLLVLKMNSWILIPSQMLLPKSEGRHLLLLLRSPLLLPKLLLVLSPLLLPKPLLLRFLPLTKSPPNSPRTLNALFKGGHPMENVPFVEVREIVPEDQAPSPSLAAFNKRFGTSHRGKLLCVGFETSGVGGKTSKFLTLWKSSAIVDETGEEASERPEEASQGSEKRPLSISETTPSPQGKTSSGSSKQVTMQHFSKQGSFILAASFMLFTIVECLSEIYSWIFQNSRICCTRTLLQSLRASTKTMPSSTQCLGRLP
jgi:hypothetical protein